VDYSSTIILGNWGEEQAARYLQQQKLQILERRYRQKWGEIDLICRDRDTWVFVEVKTRTSWCEPSAIESITRRKRQRIIRAAMSYMKWKRLEGQALRFDLVLIEAGKIEWVPDAFGASPQSTY
jgi:putative endonuclease